MREGIGGGGGPVTSADERPRGSLEGILACWFEQRWHKGEAHHAAARVPFYSGKRHCGEANGGGGSGPTTRVTRMGEPRSRPIGDRQ
jgi:hypothetical protein